MAGLHARRSLKWRDRVGFAKLPWMLRACALAAALLFSAASCGETAKPVKTAKNKQFGFVKVS